MGIGRIVLLTIAGAFLLSVWTDSASAQIKRGRRFDKGGECTRCHEMADFPGKVRHEPFGDEDCQSCHKPHGLVGMLRLKDVGPALCYQCHDQAKLGMERANLHDPAKKATASPATIHTLPTTRRSCRTMWKRSAPAAMTLRSSNGRTSTVRWKTGASPATRSTGPIIRSS
ncbi:MAG: cytochrome c3 family protein [Candidatus Eisenbacteria bacterium]